MDESSSGGEQAPGGMWRVVCIGPGVNQSPRRVVDRGPLHPNKARAQAAADWLRSTGLYESVTVVSSSIEAAGDAAGPLLGDG